MTIAVLIAALWIPQEAGLQRKDRAAYDDVIRRNIFSPPEDGPKGGEATEAPPPAAARGRRVVGVFLDAKTGTYALYIEQGKEWELLRAGEETGGCRIRSVEPEGAEVEFEGKVVMVKTGEPLPGAVPPTGGVVVSDPPEKADMPEVDPKVVERLKRRHRKKPLPEPPRQN